MIEQLQSLEAAIYEAGLWRWWAASEDVFQIEFTWVTLYLPAPESDTPPSNTIALCFREPISVISLERTTDGEEVPGDWFDKLGRDELEPLCVSEFTLTSPDALKAIYRQAERRNVVRGEPIGDPAPGTDGAFLALWADNAGLLVTARAMEVLTHRGPIPLGAIPKLRDQWWQYWRQYWDARDLDEPMPYDALCETTIPIAD